MQTSAYFSPTKLLAPLTSTLLSQRRRWLFFSIVALSCFKFSPASHALLPPPAPDGGYANRNTAEGDNTLSALTTGTDNTGLGFQALASNEDGSFNTATGSFALYNCSPGGQNNTATGYLALANTSGSFNTATGAATLSSNQSGGVNVADGYKAMEANLSGFYNVATGGFALGTNSGGSYNVATGANALYYNKGSNNTATGHQALQNNTSGGNNVALGYQAGANLTTGSNNIVIGANVPGAPGDANKIRIGKQGTQTATYIAGISGKTVASGTRVGVMIDSTGKLGTVVSSARFKQAIKPMEKASEAILQLNPVTFRYKPELDPDGAAQFGLIAEEVEKVDPDLVVRDEDGRVSTVRYEAVNAMLLNEFLKEHRTVQEQSHIMQQQEARLTKQETTIAKQQKEIETLTACLQKVSDQVELHKRSMSLVATNH